MSIFALVVILFAPKTGLLLLLAKNVSIKKKPKQKGSVEYLTLFKFKNESIFTN